MQGKQLSCFSPFTLHCVKWQGHQVGVYLADPDSTPAPVDAVPGDWKKVIVKDSNAILNNVTSSGNLVVHGNLYAQLPDAPPNNSNLRVVSLRSSNNLLFITGSYGGSSTGTQIQVKINDGSYEPLQNIVISNFESNIDIDTSGGTLSIEFN